MLIWPPMSTSAPMQRPLSVIRSITKLFSETRIDSRDRTIRINVSESSRPVASPAAWTILAKLCPPSRRKPGRRHCRPACRSGRPLAQLEHALGALRDDDLHRLAIAQAGAGRFGVLHVGLDAVGRLQHGGDATLGIPCVRLLDGVFADDQNVGRLRRGDSRAKARDPPADHENIRELLGKASGFAGYEITTLGESLEHLPAMITKCD